MILLSESSARTLARLLGAHTRLPLDHDALAVVTEAEVERIELGALLEEIEHAFTRRPEASGATG